jgi:putative ABC transport system permease protein
MADSLRDLRFTLRLLAKSPGFTAIAVLALALGIGPNTAIFSVVYASLLAPLPYPHAEQLVAVWSKVKGEDHNQVSAADFLDWKRQASSFEQMAAFVERPYNLSSTQEPQFIIGQKVSTNWYRLLGEKVWMGRDFRPDEDQPGKDHVFILSHRCWMSRFGADPHIIGKQFQVNGEPYTAIGVMPPGPSDRHHEEIWVPLRFSRAELSRGTAFWFVMGRLKSGVSIQRAQQEMNAVARRIAEQYPKTNKDWGASVEPLRNNFQDAGTLRNLWLLLAAVSFVLLIACANVANLLLVRGVARHRELVVRAALGASLNRLISQMMVESLTLAGLGGVLGILLSGALLKIILLILPPGTLSPEADVRLSLPVLLFTLATTMLSGVLFGCAPALQAKIVDLNEGLKQAGRSTMGSAHVRLREALVVIEFALALTLLAGAALTVHSFLNRTHVDLGIRTDHILTFSLHVPQSRLPRAEKTESFYRDLLAKLEAVPGVQRAAASTDTPLDDPNFEPAFSIVGKSSWDMSAPPEVGVQAVSPGYFETLGVHIDRGRMINQRDTGKSPRVAMVNETFAHRFLNGVDPLSVRITTGELQNGQLAFAPNAERQIVGVFHDVQNSARPGQPKLPQIWVPFAQSPWPNAIVAVRTAIDPARMTKAIASAVHSLDPNLPLADVKTARQLLRDEFVQDRFGIALYGSLAGIALLLASVGIYGVMSFAVAQSTPEIGVRIALGATTSHVIRHVLKRVLGMAGVGLAVGFVGAYVTDRAMQSSLYGTGTVDWGAFGAVAALLLMAALLACYVPARRASSVDPMTALRQG